MYCKLDYSFHLYNEEMLLSNICDMSNKFYFSKMFIENLYKPNQTTEWTPETLPLNII